MSPRMPGIVRICPRCEGELQATVPLHLSQIVLSDGRIDQFQFGFGTLEASLNVDSPIALTCVNGHDCTHLLVDH